MFSLLLVYLSFCLLLKKLWTDFRGWVHQTWVGTNRLDEVFMTDLDLGSGLILISNFPTFRDRIIQTVVHADPSFFSVVQNCEIDHF